MSPTDKFRINEKDYNNLDEDTFYSFLNSEIDYLRGELERPGWTNWAIVGAIASLLWFLMLEFEKSTFNFENVNFLSISILLFLFGFRVLGTAIRKNGKLNSNKLFKADRVLGNNRTYFLYLLLIVSSMYYLSFYLPTEINYYATFTIKGIFLVNSLLLLLIITLSFYNIPFGSDTSKNKIEYLVDLIIIIAISFAEYHLIDYLIDNFETFKIADLRFSMLFIGLLFLNLLFTKRPRNTLILSTLIDIRRDYAFEEIDKQEAIKRMEIALMGLKVSNLLHKYVKDFLDISDEITKKYEKIQNKLNIWENILEEDSSLADEQKEIIQSIKVSIASLLEEIENNFDDIMQVHLDMKVRERIISQIVDKKKIEENELKRVMTDRTKELKKTNERISEHRSKLIEQTP